MSWFHANPNVVYATPDDLAEYLGDGAPANAVVLLRSVSGLVRDAVAGAHYYADGDTGLPFDAQLVEALKNATCAQAAAWIALGINPLAGGVVQQAAGSGRVKASQSLDGASVTYADATAASAARAAAVNGLVPDARRYLDAYGLTATRIWTFG